MTLLIQKPFDTDRDRRRFIKKLEADDWNVSLENTDDDADFDSQYPDEPEGS